MTDRLILAAFTRARALHEGFPGFAAAAEMVSARTGIGLSKVRAALAGGWSSRDTRQRLAVFNGLTYATRHGVDVLVYRPAALTDERASPCPPRGPRKGSGACSACAADGGEAAGPNSIPTFDEFQVRAEQLRLRAEMRVRKLRGLA